MDIRDENPFEGEYCIDEGITGDGLTTELKQCQREWLLDKTDTNPYEDFFVEYENVKYTLTNEFPFNETCVDDEIGLVSLFST